jgi:deaminated glutathione amidase
VTIIKLAVHQMNSGISPEQNLKQMGIAIAAAADAGATFYFAPEMSLLLDSDKKRAAPHIRQQNDDGNIASLCDLALTHRIWLHVGSVPVATGDGKIANRSFIIDSAGKIVATYDKIHLFDVDLSTGESWRESSTYQPGTAPRVVETPVGMLGLAICYDMRFPELFAQLTKFGVGCLAIPAAFTVPTGKAHWHTLLRARAIEAAAFVVAAAQSGHHEDGRETFGHSLVIDPWGEILLDMGQGEGLGFVDIDLARIAEVRGQIPVHLNRRDIPVPV